jgi:FlaA1/EpsC-like NDP-sugar epimerase
MMREKKAWLFFYLKCLLGILLDTVILGVCYLSAFILRFDFTEPMWGWRAVAMSFITVCAVHITALAVFGCYRISWRNFAFGDLPRYILAMTIACIVLTLMRLFLGDISFAHIRPPYSISLIFFVLATMGLVAMRILWAWYSASRKNDEYLINRQIRTMDKRVAADFFRGKVVLVTGAGGSIGSELVRQVAGFNPAELILVERCENALYEIDRQLCNVAKDFKHKSLMVDINDREKMDEIFSSANVNVVLHAAAYKHVPMVELNAEEGWRNNTEATKSLAEIALKHGVERFVLISTDKAVNPVSVMGKTKLAAEKAIMAMNGGATRFCAVRFGNVLGSSGSVVPLFKEQISKREPVTVTHPAMTRYFMTITEAVGLVLQAASRSECAVFTLDMGKSIKIVDLAESMIRQEGLRPYVDIQIVYTGIRPGEKLSEELDISENSVYRTDMAKIYITKNHA